MNRSFSLLRWFFTKYRNEILVFCIVFVPRLLYSLVVQYHSGAHGFISYLDATVFLREARNLLEHGVMSQFPDPPFLPDPLRTPLYLWFLAALLWLKLPLLGIVTVQNALAAMSGVFIYRIAKTHFDAPRVGVIAAALFAVEPMSVYWNNLLMSDNLFAFLFVVSVYLFLGKKWYVGALALGLMTLARPVGMYYLPVFLLFFAAVHALNAEQKFSYRLCAPLAKKAFIIVVIFVAVVFPWMLRNKIVFDRFALSTAGWLNLYLFTMKEFAAAKGLELPMPPVPDMYHPAAYKGVMYNYEFASADFYRKQSWDLVSRYPLDYLSFHLGSGIKSMNNHDYYYLIDHVVAPEVPQVNQDRVRFLAGLGQFVWVALYVFAVAGLFQGGNMPVKIFLIALFVFTNLLIGYNGVISSGGRYNLPFVPLMLLLGTYGAFESYRWSRRASLISNP